MKEKIAVLGIGRMGSALASAFLERDYSVHIWNRTRSKCEPLAARGARIAATVEDAASAADIVVVNVSDYATSDLLLRSGDVPERLRGKLLVQLTSGSPGQAHETAAWAREHEIAYLDGAIMATPRFIGKPECLLLYSGPSELFEKYKPVLSALGPNTVHIGNDIGHAAVLDSALLVVMWGAMFGVLQGVSVSQAANLPLDTYLGYLKGFTPLLGAWTADVVERVRDGRFDGETSDAAIDVHGVALRALLDLCKDKGVHHAVPEAFNQLFQAAIAAGHGGNDIAIISKFMR